MQKPKFWNNVLIFFFVLITFSMMIYRITIHADIYDEIFNLGISYRIALGQLPFYECWESFQSGDIILAPFLWLYIKVIGRTGGIVLFSRFVYVCVLICTGFVIYVTFNKFFEKRNAFLLGYIFCFFHVYGLYYLWYDTVSVILLIVGCLLTYRAVSEDKYNKIFLLIAGIMHGLMAFSYPSYVLLAFLNYIVLLLYLLYSKKKPKNLSLFYMAGGLLVVIIFLAYIFLIVKFDNFKTGIDIILSYRSLDLQSSRTVFDNIILSYLTVNIKIIIPSGILLFIFHKALNNIKYIQILIVCILSVSFINQLLMDESLKGLANFMAYLALWAPCFYILKKKHNKKTNIAIILFLWLPSICSSICVTLLTVFAEQGPIKCWQGFILAGIVTIWYICDYFSYSRFKHVSLYSAVVLCFISFSMLFDSYNYIYLNQPYIKISNERMQEGIYKGIKVNSNMECFVELQNMVQWYTKDKNSILAGNRLSSIYLMTELLPCVPTVEAPCYYKEGFYHWEMTIKYFEVHDKYPDIMFLEPFELDNQQIQMLLGRRYELIGEETIGDFDIMVYAKK